MLKTPRAQLWGAALGLVALLRLPGFCRQLFDPDEASIASQAITLQHGGRMYVDTIDRKPPLPAEIYRVSFDLFGNSLIPLHLLMALFLAIGAAVVANDLLRRYGSPTAWWGLGLYVAGALAFLPDSAQAANYAHFALLPGTLAIVWLRRQTWAATVLAGFALGLAVLCRQTWAIGVVPGAVAIWWPMRDRRALARVVCFGACTLAVVLAPLAFVDAWGYLHWTFTSNEGFVASFGDAGLVIPSLFGQVGTFLGFHLVLVGLLVVRVAGKDFRRRWSGDLDLWVWTLTGLIAAFTGFRFFGHYFLQVLPAPVLLAAPVAAALTAKVRWRKVVSGGLVLTTVVAFVFAWIPRTLRTLPDPTSLAAYVASQTDADGRIFLWGNFPQVAWKADRPSGGALVSTDFVVGLSGNRAPNAATLKDTTPGAIKAMMTALEKHAPILILDTSTANIHDYAHYPMSVVPQLWEWVQRHYVRSDVVEGVAVYRLLDPRN